MANLIFEHLKKVYPNGFVSVDDVSLSIEDGEFVVFHGPSGCGKSTILRMIGGLEDITSGKIYLDNTFLNDILPRDRKLSMAFQNYALYKHMNSMSDSERQLVALGRAIVCHPKVLLVDEDFAHQDDNLRKDMIHDILKINKELGITVLYVTNNYEEAVSLNSRVIFMKDGKVIEDSI